MPLMNPKVENSASRYNLFADMQCMQGEETFTGFASGVKSHSTETAGAQLRRVV